MNVAPFEAGTSQALVDTVVDFQPPVVPRTTMSMAEIQALPLYATHGGEGVPLMEIHTMTNLDVFTLMNGDRRDPEVHAQTVQYCEALRQVALSMPASLD